METKNWKWFKYDEVFIIKKGKRLTIADQENGNIPYISSSAINNGVDNYIRNGHTDENCISIACYGSIGETFYHKGKVWISDNANVIYLKNKTLNSYIAMFVISILEKEKYRFSYGVTGKKERLNSLKIKLPINDKCTPDWQFIENYVKEGLIPKLPTKAKSVWQKQFDKTPLSNKKLELKVEEWKWFELKKIFTVERGTRLTKPDREIGKIPLITAGRENEGVAEYISNQDQIRYQNAITIDMFGFSCYRGYVFCCDDNVLVLSNEKMTNYSGIFISSIINKDDYKCAYGRQYRQKTLANHKILLPATPTGTPDWQFMENYIKSLPYSRCL